MEVACAPNAPGNTCLLSCEEFMIVYDLEDGY